MIMRILPQFVVKQTAVSRRCVTVRRLARTSRAQKTLTDRRVLSDQLTRSFFISKPATKNYFLHCSLRTSTSKQTLDQNVESCGAITPNTRFNFVVSNIFPLKLKVASETTKSFAKFMTKLSFISTARCKSHFNCSMIYS